MRYLSLLAFVPIILVTGATLSTPAAAAKAGAVMQACDNVASGGGSCSYKIDPNGDVYGCAQAKGSSKKSCFTCPGGGGDCASSLKSGRPAKGPVMVGTIKLPPAPPQGGKGKAGLTPVAVGGSKQTGNGKQPVTLEHTNNTQHSGSGGGGSKK